MYGSYVRRLHSEQSGVSAQFGFDMLTGSRLGSRLRSIVSTSGLHEVFRTLDFVPWTCQQATKITNVDIWNGSHEITKWRRKRCFHTDSFNYSTRNCLMFYISVASFWSSSMFGPYKTFQCIIIWLSCLLDWLQSQCSWVSSPVAFITLKYSFTFVYTSIK